MNLLFDFHHQIQFFQSICFSLCLLFFLHDVYEAKFFINEISLFIDMSKWDYPINFHILLLILSKTVYLMKETLKIELLNDIENYLCYSFVLMMQYVTIFTTYIWFGNY